MERRILFTTPCYPYPTLPFNDSITDATGQRFTKGDDIFTIISHTHCFANHILAQNVSWPSLVLEYPRWQDFTDEVDKGYPYLGISAYPPHLDMVMRMCEYARRRSPATQILLGSYAAQAFQAVYDLPTQKKYVDHLVLGEGVRFLRTLLGDPSDAPIRQVLMPKAGGTIPFITRHPKGSVGFLVSGLGCIGGCDFCSTTAMFGNKRIELLSPEETVREIELYHDHFPDVMMVFIIEEDHFRVPQHLHAMREHWLARPEMSERLDLFTFGSVDNIAKFAKAYGWDAILEAGVGCIFIGVESKFAGQHGYDKRDEVDAKEVFDRLHGMGIRTVGAWMCGWDWHDRPTMMEDLNYFVSLRPTYQQLTRVSPFPGTPLWEKLQEEGRVQPVPWEDVHFWSGAQKNVHLEAHETLNLIDEGYGLMYRTWGPSVMRRLDVTLNGFAHCSRSESPVMRRHRARFFRRQASMLWWLLPACDRFAPNGAVRRQIRKLDDKYRSLVGEPTPAMRTIATWFEQASVAARLRELVSPQNRYVKEEPFKRYVYDKDGAAARATRGNGRGGGDGATRAGRNGRRTAGSGHDPAIPYRTEWPTPDPAYDRDVLVAKALWFAIRASCAAARRLSPRGGDADLDDYLMARVSNERFGIGF
jgi:haloalkane dehalogenase